MERIKAKLLLIYDYYVLHDHPKLPGQLATLFLRLEESIMIRFGYCNMIFKARNDSL